MSSSDEPSRTHSQIAAAPASAPAASSAAGPAVRTTDDHPLTQESFRAVFSSHQRAGRWAAADEIEVRAVFGEVTLDLTRAELPPGGVIEINALALFGSVEIIVPDGAEVDLDGTPVLGSIEQQHRKRGAREQVRAWVTGERGEDFAAPHPSPEPPYFRIDARAILGSIKVTGR